MLRLYSFCYNVFMNINQIKQDTAPPVDIDTLDDFENMDITDDTK